MLGITKIFIEMLYLIGILFLLIIVFTLLGGLKAIIENLFLANKGKKIYKLLIKIEKKATEVLKDFNKGMVGSALIGVEELNELNNEFELMQKEEKEKKV